MRRITLPPEIVYDYNQRHKDYTDLDRKVMRCRLCQDLWTAQRQGLAEYWSGVPRSRYKGGEEVYEVTFKNGTVSHYHVECMERLQAYCNSNNAKPWICKRLEHIIKLDKDSIPFENLQTLVKEMRKTNATTREIVVKLMDTYSISQASAYRKIHLVG